MKLITTFTFTLLLIASTSVSAKRYYINPLGNDTANNGLSISSAWKSANAIKTRTIQAGDTIAFEGGQSFVGSITLDSTDMGTDANPIVITTYGTGKATINSDTLGGFFAHNIGGITLENIEFIGCGSSKSKHTAIAFYIDSALFKYPAVKVNNVIVHGYKEAITFGNWEKNYNGYKKITLTNSKAYECTKGITVFDQGSTSIVAYAHDEVQIANCEVYKINSSGIVVSGTAKGLIEYCYVHDCSGKEGLCIWVYNASNITIQHCIAANFKSSGTDGGAFDLDGGSVNCVIQYCYSYNNDGVAAMICDYPKCRPTYNNVIRFCISENDCRKEVVQIAYGFLNWGTGIKDSYVYNNTVYLTQPTTSKYNRAALGYSRTGGGYATAPVSNCKILNNIAYISGSNLSFVNNGYNKGASYVDYLGNCYHTENTGDFRDGGVVYPSLDAWRTAKTDQEKNLDGKSGFKLDPLFVKPGGAGQMTDPTKLSEMTAYLLTKNSPCYSAGIDLNKQFGISIGLLDFIGNSNTKDNTFDIGACKSSNDIVNISTTKGIISNISPNPCHGFFKVQTEIIDATTLNIYNMNGNLIKSIIITSNETTIGTKDIPNGIYIVQLISKNTILTQVKLLNYID